MVLSSKNQRHKSRFHTLVCEHKTPIKRQLNTAGPHAFLSFFKHSFKCMKDVSKTKPGYFPITSITPNK